jgi:hypothetical protein
LTEEESIIAEGRRYVTAQQARIETQREFIRQLEGKGHDPQIVRMEKETLAEMIMSLDLVLDPMRSVIYRAD